MIMKTKTSKDNWKSLRLLVLLVGVVFLLGFLEEIIERTVILNIFAGIGIYALAGFINEWLSKKITKGKK